MYIIGSVHLTFEQLWRIEFLIGSCSLPIALYQPRSYLSEVAGLFL